MQCQPTILTLHDAVTDSPVYRANALHFDDQIDLLEKWLDQLSKHLKLYNEKLHKFNLETNNVCKKTIPQGIDSTLIDPNFTGAVIRTFSDALQTSLAFKTKLVSDLEDNFIQPLQQFVKTHLKDFKEFRKQHEKALERYESQLYRYTAQSKAKEASAVREEAFRLHEARKAYVRMSGQHVIRILQFRSVLEHCLVDCFSSATLAHSHDFDGGKQVWTKLDSSLASWKQWLVDDRSTCDYQLHRLQAARRQLESEYLQQTQPIRDLEKYGSSTASIAGSVAGGAGSRHSLDMTFSSNKKVTSNTKWGYLYARVSRLSWTRKWFFLYNGYFGTCSVSTKLKGTISVGEKVSVLLCDIKPVTDVDRRFCFEVVSVQQPSLFLQAETEEEMHDWIASFAKAKHLLLDNEKLTLHTALPTVTTPTATLTSTIANPPTDSSGSDFENASCPTTAIYEEKPHPAIVMLSISADNQEQVALATSTSLTPLLVSEAVKAQVSANNPSATATTTATSTTAATTITTTAATTTTTAAATASSFLSNSPGATTQTFMTSTSSTPSLLSGSQSTNTTANASGNTVGTPAQSGSGSWGIPWALVPNMFTSASQEDETPLSPMSPTMPATSALFSSTTDGDGYPIVWPIRFDDTHMPKPDLTGYTPDLEAKNKELRRLFSGVKPNEVVLDSFIGSLKKKPAASNEDGFDSSSSTSVPSGSPTVDTFDQELNMQLGDSLKKPISQFGYSYTGRAFITQETLWYYSCILMNCVNTVAVQLSDIKNVRLVRDPSVKDMVTKTGPAKNVALALDLEYQSEPIVISTLLNDVEVVLERLRLAVENSKIKVQQLPVQVLYDVIQSMSASESKSSTTHKVTSSNSDTTSAPAGTSSSLASKSQSDSDTKLAEIYQPEPAVSPVPENKKLKQRKGRKSLATDKQNSIPKAGALAAAMMAATVAGGTGLFDASKMADAAAAQKRYHATEESVLAATPPPPPMPSAAAPSSTAGTVATVATTVEGSAADGAGDEDEVPANIQVPKGPAGCKCDEHLDKVEDEVELPVSAKKLYDYLFGEESAIWELKNTAGGGTNLRIDPWVNIEGKPQRTLKYILPVSNPMVKIKEAEVVETQVLLKKEEYIRYVVQISTKTAQLPYADAFVPSVRYCISWMSKSSCKLTCSIGVKFVKSVLVKGMISKAAIKGMGESIQQFVPILVRETNAMAGKGLAPAVSAAGGLGTQAIKANQQPQTPSAAGGAAVSATKVSSKGSSDEGLWAYWNTAVAFVTELPLSVKAGVANIPSYAKSDRAASSRTVYLRDLEDGLLKTHLQPSYVGDESYQLFLANGTSHPWYSPEHQRMAVEFLFSRERVAMLRYDMLVVFDLLNQVDAQLLENEYINWMLDTRLQCRRSSKESPSESQQRTCDVIRGQLESFFA
ncbi:hypothetical protein BX666DRAFT_2023819 [Dichotomocladium elegans]|nr:hypothetical protein BX666DRAFT_2023819 [Dichotomocladium elegans]